MTVRENVLLYIEELTNEKISNHEMNLFENNLLTSLDVLDLISFIEKNYDLQVAADDVDMESLGSIDGIVHLVEKLKQQ
ncbi:MAG: hypothetical protein JXB88_23095 [Spirochaetales bacterium]|nr:hypothetical protein [Spirochaetales bacterium]